MVEGRFFAFTVAVLFVPGLHAAATTPRWALLAIGLPVILTRAPRAPLTVAHIWGIGFVAWSALSLLWTAEPLDGLNALAQLGILAMAFALGSTPYRWFGIGIAVSSVIAVGQAIGWSPIDAVGPAGLFINRNLLAEAAALALIPALLGRSWWLAAVIAPAVILPGERGAWIALAVAALVWLWPRHKRWAASLGVLAVILTAGLLTLHGASLGQRLGVWLGSIPGLTLSGRGIGSFYTLFPAFGGAHLDTLEIRPVYAHNEPLQIAFELGTLGLVLAAGLVWSLFRHAEERERLILVAVLVMSLVWFPLHCPATAFLAALAAGHAARRGVPLRDLLPARRVGILGRLARPGPAAAI